MSLPSELLPVGLLGTGAAAAEAEGYTIERSVRFNSSDSAYLGRDFISDGDRKTWTWAGWVKRSVVSSGQQTIFGSYDGSSGAFTRIGFQSNDVLWFQVGGSGGVYRNITSAVYRDPGAWLHLVATLDTTQATASDRVRLWVNGVLQVFGTTSYPTLNYAGGHINQGIWHAVGAEINDSTVAASSYFSGYLADIHFIDGQALDPTSFGEFDTNGIWQPIEYTGTYPGNSFHLPFNDNSTAAALGTDTSGNGNTWTVNNISVASGAGNDSLVDVPTNGTETDTGLGGQVRGNYCTLNPLAQSSGTFSNGNLEYVGPSSWKAAPSTILLPSTGKYFVEATLKANPFGSTFGSLWSMVGVIAPSAISGWSYNSGTSFFVADTGHYSNYSTSSSGTIGTFSTGTVIGLAIDRDTNEITVYQNGTSKATVTLAITSGADLYVFNGSYNTQYGQMALNFGARSFAYTAPSGFKALCTANLPSTTITTSGSFTGNSSTDGPFVYLNGVPTAMTINSNSVTFGTHADKLSNGFKVRSSSSSYNQSGSNTYSITSTGDAFKNARAQTNP